jgi:hypothetical protein
MVPLEGIEPPPEVYKTTARPSCYRGGVSVGFEPTLTDSQTAVLTANTILTTVLKVYVRNAHF